MEKNTQKSVHIYIYIYVCVCVYVTNSLYCMQNLIQHCKLTILRFLKIKLKTISAKLDSELDSTIQSIWARGRLFEAPTNRYERDLSIETVKPAKGVRNLMRKMNLKCTCSNSLSKSDFLWFLHTGTGRILSMEVLSIFYWHFHLILFQSLKKSVPFDHFSPFISLFLASHGAGKRCPAQKSAQVIKETYQTMEICKDGALVDACWSLWVCAFQVPSLVRMFLPSGIRNTQEENFSCMLPEY